VKKQKGSDGSLPRFSDASQPSECYGRRYAALPLFGGGARLRRVPCRATIAVAPRAIGEYADGANSGCRESSDRRTHPFGTEGWRKRQR